MAAKKILKKAKVINTVKDPKFDPRSVLKGKTVTKKSPLADMILDAICSLDKNRDGASIHVRLSLFVIMENDNF